MIARDYYKNPLHFIDQVGLTFQNAISFNKKGSPIYKAAQTMKKDMDRLIKEFDIISEQAKLDILQRKKKSVAKGP